MSDLSRGELNDLLAGFAAKDENYRKALKKDPRGVIEKQLNNELPSSLSVKVIEDTPDTIHIVLPHTPGEGEELSDSDLESVAGGFLDKYSCRTDAKIQGAGFASGTRVQISVL